MVKSAALCYAWVCIADENQTTWINMLCYVVFNSFVKCDICAQSKINPILFFLHILHIRAELMTFSSKHKRQVPPAQAMLLSHCCTSVY